MVNLHVIHLNTSKRHSPLTGTKRYEDELFNNINKLNYGISLKRVQRSDNKYLGCSLASWPTIYNFGNADIVHATYHTIAPAIYFRKCTPFTRNSIFLVTVLDLIPLLYSSTLSDISTKIQWLLTPSSLKKADNLIAISDFTKREIIRICDIRPDKIHVVHLGVDRSKYHPIDREDSKKSFNLDLKEKHILVVGSNLEHKRMDLVKRIFDKIRTIRQNIKLLKVGYGQELDGEGIINLGWIPEEDMPILFNAADVYLHTSEYEGFGFPILEAMACGVPVVASRKASIPEILGDCGSMVDLESEDCVEHFVEELLKAIDKDIDEREIERSKEFSWEKTAKKTVEVYKQSLC